MGDEALKKFQEISALLNSSLDPAEIRRRAIDAATAILHAEACSLLLLAEESGDLYFEVALGAKGDQVQNVRVQMGQGIAGHVARTGRPLVINNVQQDSRFWSEVDAQTGFVTRNMVCVPVTARDRLLGVLQALNKKGGGEFDERDLESFVAFGHQVGIAIENAKLYDEIQHLFEGFVSASVQAIESRDPTTSGHSHRVALLTCGLAEVVDRTDGGPYASTQFNDEQMRELRFAAVLHDFGKVGVREHVLVKARKLYPGDLALVKARFDFIKRTAEVEMLRKKVEVLQSGSRNGIKRELSRLDQDLARRLKELEDMFAHVLDCNEPGGTGRGGYDRLQEMARLRFESFDGPKPYLTPEEVTALSIPGGTLTTEERLEIESHVTHTYEYLRKIPWSKSLQHVPTIAYAHHEKLDGTGYPRRILMDQIPVQSRIMTIADIYDALAAADRPYKAAVPPTKALEILEQKAGRGEIDGTLVTLFVEAKIYTRTAKRPRTHRPRLS